MIVVSMSIAARTCSSRSVIPYRCARYVGSVYASVTSPAAFSQAISFSAEKHTRNLSEVSWQSANAHE